MYLLDGTPVIYVHHIGGHFSVFNTDMISELDVYKGAFPTKYGERLSSIISITQKTDHPSNIRGTLSVGITDISFSIEGPGPFKLKNSGFIIAGRKTFIDLYYMLSTGFLHSLSGSFLAYGFHDLNGKFWWNHRRKHRLFLNVYQGDDYFSMLSTKKVSMRPKNVNVWGNFLISAHWDYVSERNFLIKTNLSYTTYRLRNTSSILFREDSKKEMTRQELFYSKSSIADISLKSDIKYSIKNDLSLDFGYKVSYLKYVPINYRTKYRRDFDKTEALQTLLYFSNKAKIFKRLDTDIGFRIINYMNQEISHFAFEPRLNISYYFKKNHSLNASYMRVSQNAQVLSRGGSITANEIFVSSGEKIQISISNQFTMAWRMNFLQEMYEIELLGYYKTLEGLTDFKEGESFTQGDLYWREKLLTGGRGEAKGIELTFKKQKGKWTGLLTYTLSNSMRQFKDINKGKAFVFDFDSPHSLSLFIAYRISDKWNFGLAWQYQTGLPYTPVTERYHTIDIDPETGGYIPYEVVVYGDRNSARMRDYHRMDCMFTYRKYTKRGNRSEWTFGIHNLYNRHNAYYYFYDSPGNNGVFDSHDPRQHGFSPLVLKYFSLISLMPIVSYKVWFGENSKKVNNKLQTTDN